MPKTLRARTQLTLLLPPLLPIFLPLFFSTISTQAIAETSHNQVLALPLSVALAQTFKSHLDGKFVADYWISEKLDGVRAIWDGQTLRFKSGRLIHAPPWFTKNFPACCLDGELWIERGQFDRVSSIVRQQFPDDQAWRTISFNVFDLPSSTSTFTLRIEEMKSFTQHGDIPWLKVVEQFRIQNELELQDLLASVIHQGGEGLMLHQANARWEVGRNRQRLKLKPFDDAEAIVMGHEPGKGGLSGKVGALILRMGNGQTFRLGSGLSDAIRQNPPAIGSQITYRYRGKTPTGLPRFATFWRMREEE